MALRFTDISTIKPNSGSSPQKVLMPSFTPTEAFTKALALNNASRHFLLEHAAAVLNALLLLYLTASAGAFQVFINAWWALSNGSGPAQSCCLSSDWLRPRGKEAWVQCHCQFTRWWKKLWRRGLLLLPFNLEKGCAFTLGLLSSRFSLMLKPLADGFVYIKVSSDSLLVPWWCSACNILLCFIL